VEISTRTRAATMHTQEESFSEMGLFQITDSAFPLGGFAFSYGLESMAKLGLIKDVSAFKKYLSNVLAQISGSEMPFLNSAYIIAPEPYEALIPIFEQIDAFITIPCIRKGSITQGRSLLQIVKAVYLDQGFDQFIHWLRQHDLPSHYAPVFGFVCRKIGFSHTEVLSAYVYIALRDQTSAAIRLGLLGPHEAQAILRETLRRVNGHIDRVKGLSYDQAFKVAVALEIAQAHHPNLYSHLFQN
jgi:urease accessory protein